MDKGELDRARKGENEEEWQRRQKRNEPPGEPQIARCLSEHQITVVKAPKGMRREKENTTSWNRKQKAVNWQVEWLREEPKGKLLYKVTGNKPIGELYDGILEEERKMAMTDEEKRAEKKRKAEDNKIRNAKRVKLERQMMDLSTTPILQDLETTAWNSTLEQSCDDEEEILEQEIPTPKKRSYNLYLLRPLTPASFPKVLSPVDPNKTLTDILRNRDVLEFPTIHVLDVEPKHLPSTFMLEKKYLAAIGQKGALETDTEMNERTEDSDDTSSSESDSDSDTSSSEEESSDEDGEIV